MIVYICKLFQMASSITGLLRVAMKVGEQKMDQGGK
jgi:hypothetical protein